jgi:hypothetical protein
MREFTVNGSIIYKADYSEEPKYRKDLSAKLREHMGNGPYSDHVSAREAITFSFNYFCDKFIEICQSETSVRFYQLILSQHERAVHLALFANSKDYPDGISAEYIAVYRRILKWVLEQACEIPLHNEENADKTFLERSKAKINELFFLGDMIFNDAVMYAGQDMIEDAAQVQFDHEGLYEFKLKHHYDYIIGEIQRTYGAHSIKHVVDETATDDLVKALLDSFGLNYKHLSTVIAAIHDANKEKGGYIVGFEWEALPYNAEQMFNENIDQARLFYQGLTLNKHNKLPLNELACRPQTMNRLLYRPILVWNIDGQDFAVVGTSTFAESIIQLATNTIPWGKGPEEWLTNPSFKKYVHSKEDEHDKWLDDEVEKHLINRDLRYFRNVTNISTPHGRATLNAKAIGEIDFIIVNHELQKIYIADCKHLQGRYDMITQKNDYSNFTKKNGYNTQIQNKLNWATSNITNLNHHLHETYPEDASIVKYEIEGIFIINTPTFYMHNSDFRIYTVDLFVDIITGKLVDSVIHIIVEEANTITNFSITYPYFRKPEYKLIQTLPME